MIQDEYFESLKSRYYNYLVSKYNALYSQARNKEYLKEFISNLILIGETFSNNPYKLDLLQAFEHNYKLGFPIKEVFKQIDSIRNNHLPDSFSFMDPNFLYIKDENKLIKFFIGHSALEDFKKFLMKHGNENLSDPVLKEAVSTLIEQNKSKESPPRIKRTKNDNITKLSLEQTALLIYFLRQSKIILGESYLPKTGAAEAIEILTGYSKNTLRPELSDLSFNKENLSELQKAVSELNSLIQKELKKF